MGRGVIGFEPGRVLYSAIASIEVPLGLQGTAEYPVALASLGLRRIAVSYSATAPFRSPLSAQAVADPRCGSKSREFCEICARTGRSPCRERRTPRCTALIFKATPKHGFRASSGLGRARSRKWPMLPPARRFLKEVAARAPSQAELTGRREYSTASSPRAEFRQRGGQLVIDPAVVRMTADAAEARRPPARLPSSRGGAEDSNTAVGGGSSPAFGSDASCRRAASRAFESGCSLARRGSGRERDRGRRPGQLQE